MGDYVDTYTSLLNSLAAMNSPIPNYLAVVFFMFLSSPKGNFGSTVAAIRSISDENLTWDYVTSGLIEEASSTRSRTRQDSSLAVHSRPICSFCGRQDRKANRCFTNPSNPKKNRLGTPPWHPSSQHSGPNRRSAMVHDEYEGLYNLLRSVQRLSYDLTLLLRPKRDLSSQIGLLTCIFDPVSKAANVIQYSSTKCKRVAHSALTAKLRAMVDAHDVGMSTK
jgi:hypothetical protein